VRRSAKIVKRRQEFKRERLKVRVRHRQSRRRDRLQRFRIFQAGTNLLELYFFFRFQKFSVIRRPVRRLLRCYPLDYNPHSIYPFQILCRRRKSGGEKSDRR